MQRGVSIGSHGQTKAQGRWLVRRGAVWKLGLYEFNVFWDLLILSGYKSRRPVSMLVDQYVRQIWE